MYSFEKTLFMKKITLLLFLITASVATFAQAKDKTEIDSTLTYRIVKTDGGELIGKILSQDEREVYFLTKDNRRIYIPQHLIEKITVLNASDFNAKGTFVGEDAFATRYFITTNGLPIKKGEHYIQWNLFGPDLQFGVGENLSVGLLTTWVGIPIIASIKKSWQVGEKTQLALGALVGTGSWALPQFAGALPFGTISFGDRSKNIAFSAGYGAAIFEGDFGGRAMTSVAGMIKVSNKLSLVFDSFILLPGKEETVSQYEPYTVFNPNTGQYETQFQLNTYEEQTPGLALLIPGLRWHKSEGSAFQIGFVGAISDSELVPVPIPMVQWYRKL